MARYLKNSSGKSLVIGELNFSWLKDRVYDIDTFDKILIIKAQDVLRTLIDCGDLKPVDKDGNLLGPVTVEEVYIEDEYLGGMDYIENGDKVEYADDIENGEKYILNRVGGRMVFHMDTLKRVLLMHFNELQPVLTQTAWEVKDMEDLKLVRKFHNSYSVKKTITEILKKLEVEQEWVK